MKIALLGSAPSTAGSAPFQAKDWQIWGCSPGALAFGEHADAWFELHRYEPGQPWFSEGYCSFLENFEGPVYMAEPTPQVKNCVVIPVNDLVAKYSPYWFNSSISWMFAMAIEAQAKTIGLWGVDMAASEEYFSQKMGCIWFAQLAQSMGIEVGVLNESDLLVPPPLYGVCETSHQWIKQTIRTRELQAQYADAERLARENQERAVFLKGALDDMNYQQHTWSGNMAALGSRFVSPAHAPVLDQVKLAPKDMSDDKIIEPVDVMGFKVKEDPLLGPDEIKIVGGSNAVDAG